MSEPENDSMPRPHDVVVQDGGVASWRPVLTSLQVVTVPNGRHVVISDDGIERFRFELSAAQAEHLSRLLA